MSPFKGESDSFQKLFLEKKLQLNAIRPFNTHPGFGLFMKRIKLNQ